MRLEPGIYEGTIAYARYDHGVGLWPIILISDEAKVLSVYFPVWSIEAPHLQIDKDGLRVLINLLPNSNWQKFVCDQGTMVSDLGLTDEEALRHVQTTPNWFINIIGLQDLLHEYIEGKRAEVEIGEGGEAVELRVL